MSQQFRAEGIHQLSDLELGSAFADCISIIAKNYAKPTEEGWAEVIDATHDLRFIFDKRLSNNKKEREYVKQSANNRKSGTSTGSKNNRFGDEHDEVLSRLRRDMERQERGKAGEDGVVLSRGIRSASGIVW